MDRRFRFTGVAITLWLLILSVVIGESWRCFWRLVVSPVINTSSFNLVIYLYFSRYAAVCSVAGVYSGMYTLEIVKGTEFLNAFSAVA